MSVVLPNQLRVQAVISPFDQARQRDIGYDLSVGSIFVPPDDGDLRKKEVGRQSSTPLDSYDIPPMGIVVVCSLEKLKVPANMFADAVPKSSLCEKGLLALNTGVVDPGYEGDIVATMLNFSNKPIPLKKGDAFLRLVFYDVQLVGPPSNVRKPDERKGLALSYPMYFLNFHSAAGRIAEETFGRLLPRGTIITALVALVIGFGTMTVTGVTYMVNLFNARQDRADLVKSNAALVQSNKDLAEKVAQGQARVKEMEEKMRGLDTRVQTVEEAVKPQ